MTLIRVEDLRLGGPKGTIKSNRIRAMDVFVFPPILISPKNDGVLAEAMIEFAEILEAERANLIEKAKHRV